MKVSSKEIRKRDWHPPQIVYGGAAGLHIQGTTELGSVRTQDEVIEVIGALTQMYREQGYYLERIYKWADRVGYDHIKSVIMGDAAQRRTYYERFVYSQSFAQIDPWAERVAGRFAHEFTPLSTLARLEAAE